MIALRDFLVLGLLLGCGRAAGSADPQPCGPVASELPGEASADLLAGEFRLRLVATSGEKRGSSTEGSVTLLPYDLAQPRIDLSGATDTAHAYPLYGFADLDLAAVGAAAPGDLASDDPAGPGVLVIERLTSPSGRPGRMTLRLGSEANRQGVVRFDGGFAVLRVRQVDEAGFAGSWESGTALPNAGGHFCATRLPPASR